MRIEWNPESEPLSDSKRFPGGTFKSANRGHIDVLQFPLCDGPQFSWESSRDARSAVEKQIFRQLSSERDNHIIMLSQHDNRIEYGRQVNADIHASASTTSFCDGISISASLWLQKLSIADSTSPRNFTKNCRA